MITIDGVRCISVLSSFVRMKEEINLTKQEAIDKLTSIERYYICKPEREDCKKTMIERGYEIDTKLKLAKREFKTGLYIEELLK